MSLSLKGSRAAFLDQDTRIVLVRVVGMASWCMTCQGKGVDLRLGLEVVSYMNLSIIVWCEFVEYLMSCDQPGG